MSRPLTRENVSKAHELIKPYIHLTPVVTSETLSSIASTPQAIESRHPEKPACSSDSENDTPPANPKINLFFKCENLQKVGAFKARGAFHALSRLLPGQLEDGVITHSSGNHAQALAFAARTRGVEAHIVMPTISTPSKIEATKGYGANVYFSGSTSEEREALVDEIQKETGARLIPPYDHADIILGQGTLALEFEMQVKESCTAEARREKEGYGWRHKESKWNASVNGASEQSEGLDAVICACGGGGMLSGIATALSGTGIAVFGAEPSFEGADDCRRGLAMNPPTRIESVKSLTIADGVRTPVGKIPWTVISDKSRVRGVYAVTEDQIKAALRLVFERMKMVVEPSAVVPLAVVLYNEKFRRLVEREAGPQGWNIGVVFGGGNTTMEALGKLFETTDMKAQRAEALMGMNGEKIAENVAG